MDRDAFLKMLEDTCCYNIENFVFDKEWSGVSGLSHVNGEDMEDFLTIEDKSDEGKKKEKGTLLE